MLKNKKNCVSFLNVTLKTILLADKFTPHKIFRTKTDKFRTNQSHCDDFFTKKLETRSEPEGVTYLSSATKSSLVGDLVVDESSRSPRISPKGPYDTLKSVNLVSWKKRLTSNWDPFRSKTGLVIIFASLCCSRLIETRIFRRSCHKSILLDSTAIKRKMFFVLLTTMMWLICWNLIVWHLQSSEKSSASQLIRFWGHHWYMQSALFVLVAFKHHFPAPFNCRRKKWSTTYFCQASLERLLTADNVFGRGNFISEYDSFGSSTACPQ